MVEDIAVMFVMEHLPFALLSLATVAISAGLARYAWKRRAVAGATEFALLMLAIAWISCCAAADYLLSTVALPLKLLANQLYVIGGAVASMFLLLFVLRYTHRDQWLTRRHLILLWVMLAVGIVVMLANEWHRLYWPAIYADPADPTASLIYTYGPLNRLMAFYTYGITLFAAGLIIYSAARAPALYRLQYIVIVAALAVPVVANLIYYVGVFPWRSFDLTPVSYSVSGCLMAWAIFRLQFLDLAPLAQDALFANLSDGVVALNAHGQIVAVNPAAQTLLAAGERALIGVKVATLPPPWGDACAALLDCGEMERELRAGGRSIAVSKSILGARQREPVGHILLLHDVTSYRVLQDELMALNSELEDRVADRTAELQQTVARLQSEIQERQNVEATLRHMQESLADHVTGLSHHLSALYEVILLGGKSVDLDAVRRLTLTTIENALHADAGFLFNYLPGAEHFDLAVQHGFTDEQIAQLVTTETAWLLCDPIPRTILDLPTATVLPESVRIPGMQACLLAAIVRMDTAVGAVGVYWREQPALSVEEIALFRALGDQLAVLAENARLRQVREQALVQEERQRIARDLHDSVTQSLYALTLNADTAAARMQNGRTAGLEELLGRIAVASSQALREIRLLLYELRLATPDAMPLAAALQLRLDAVEKRAGIDAALAIDAGLTIAPPVAQALYWITVEALNNSLKHAAARHVTVSIHRSGADIELTVTDDGDGLPPAVEQRGGFGLRSMAERAAQYGGTLAVGATATGGAQVTVRMAAVTQQPDPGNILREREAIDE